ncbi:acyltransferase [Acinetobacter wuhouensis]|uniref:acyltransferase family protein n=1 Tax=Acinetobacter wuhouensis TaxID=1879050 RepID=UPI00083B13F3|nr:acyltransferase [Acinetobacter wuhouensis]AXQ23921.1 acyltransferase [Acinetobacter wuhouensis]
MSNTISAYMDSRKNNLDIIRFIAASLVIFSHAFPIVYGKGNEDPLAILLHGQTTIGGIAVGAFFIISGFLICQSFQRSKSLKDYILARSLRIFPALIGCFIFMIFIMGPMVTELSVIDYFKNIQTYKFFIGATTLNFLAPTLPGVFLNNPYPLYINGSLWTLKFELGCYILIAILGLMLLLKKHLTLAFALICVGLSYLKVNDNLHNLFVLISYFMMGATFYLYRESIKLEKKIFFISIFFLIFLTYFNLYYVGFSIFGTYIIIYLSYISGTFKNFAKYGDFSYGIYIYAFPIQQSLVYFTKNSLNVYWHSLISLVIVIIFAFLSWNLIEKPSMRLKKKLSS